MSAVLRPLVALLAGALLLAGCGGPTGAAADPRPAPVLAGADLDGVHRDAAELRGSVVVVSAWASWCAPCREEIPVLARAQDELGPHGLQVLGLNVRDRPEQARRFAEEHGASFPSVVDADGTIAVEWGLTGVPESFVVDRAGNVVEHHFGAVTEEWIDSVVAPVVLP